MIVRRRIPHLLSWVAILGVGIMPSLSGCHKLGMGDPRTMPDNAQTIMGPKRTLPKNMEKQQKKGQLPHAPAGRSSGDAAGTGMPANTWTAESGWAAQSGQNIFSPMQSAASSYPSSVPAGRSMAPPPAQANALPYGQAAMPPDMQAAAAYGMAQGYPASAPSAYAMPPMQPPMQQSAYAANAMPPAMPQSSAHSGYAAPSSSAPMGVAPPAYAGTAMAMPQNPAYGRQTMQNFAPVSAGQQSPPPHDYYQQELAQQHSQPPAMAPSSVPMSQPVTAPSLSQMAPPLPKEKPKSIQSQNSAESFAKYEPSAFGPVQREAAKVVPVAQRELPPQPFKMTVAPPEPKVPSTHDVKPALSPVASVASQAMPARPVKEAMPVLETAAPTPQELPPLPLNMPPLPLSPAASSRTEQPAPSIAPVQSDVAAIAAMEQESAVDDGAALNIELPPLHPDAVLTMDALPQEKIDPPLEAYSEASASAVLPEEANYGQPEDDGDIQLRPATNAGLQPPTRYSNRRRGH